MSTGLLAPPRLHQPPPPPPAHRHRRAWLIVGVVALAVLVVLAFFALRPTLDKAVASTQATSTAPAPSGALRSISTPKIVIDDMHLAPKSCTAVVKDSRAGQVLPDPKCTPGAVDPAVTQANIQSTICTAGYTETVRPSVTATNKLKTVSLAAYGMAYSPQIEFDHLVSLQLGGASTSSNLWPEPNRDGAPSTTNPKDAVETKLKVAVCANKVTLAAAQQAIASDWTTALVKLGVK